MGRAAQSRVTVRIAPGPQEHRGRDQENGVVEVGVRIHDEDGQQRHREKAWKILPRSLLAHTRQARLPRTAETANAIHAASMRGSEPGLWPSDWIVAKRVACFHGGVALVTRTRYPIMVRIQSCQSPGPRGSETKTRAAVVSAKPPAILQRRPTMSSARRGTPQFGFAISRPRAAPANPERCRDQAA